MDRNVRNKTISLAPNFCRVINRGEFRVCFLACFETGPTFSFLFCNKTRETFRAGTPPRQWQVQSTGKFAIYVELTYSPTIFGPPELG